MMHEEARLRKQATKSYFTAAYSGTASRIQDIIDAGEQYCVPSTIFRLPERGERYLAFLKGHQYERAVLGIIDRPYPNPDETSRTSFECWFNPGN